MFNLLGPKPKPLFNYAITLIKRNYQDAIAEDASLEVALSIQTLTGYLRANSQEEVSVMIKQVVLSNYSEYTISYVISEVPV